jgi:hypothetical protein
MKPLAASTIIRLHSLEQGSFDHGKAVADAYLEASQEQPSKGLKAGQVVKINGKPARVISIAANGVWIIRPATDGEWARQGKDQIKERVSIKSISI